MTPLVWPHGTSDQLRLGTFGALACAAALVFAWAVATPAAAEDDDSSRGVHILDAPPAAAPALSPAAPTLSPPAPTLTPPVPALAPPAATPAVPTLTSPEPAAAVPASTPPVPSLTPPVPTASAPVPVVAAPPEPGEPALKAPGPPVELGSLRGKVKVANPADLSVVILPGQEVPAGTRISFMVTSKRSGYLILVDVDAGGKLTQIYPNPISLMRASAIGGTPPPARNSHRVRGTSATEDPARRKERDGRKPSNFVRARRPVVIPDPDDPYAGFEFIATAAAGPSMVVAMLSDRPVQLIDLPDLPAEVAGQASALTYLSNLAADLKIPQGDGGKLDSVTWSFDASVYAVTAN